MTLDLSSMLDAPDYTWLSRDPGATEHEIEALRAYYGRPLPRDYEALLRLTGGGVIECGDLWTLRLWNVKDIPEWSAAYQLDVDMPEAKTFGDNGGGEAFVFDLRPKHADGNYPVCAVNFISPVWEYALPVAKNLTDLLLLRRPLLG